MGEFAAGHMIFIGDNHAETIASNPSFAIANSAYNNPGFVLSIDHTASLPPIGSSLKGGASYQTTTTTGLNVTSGCFYMYGVTLIAGSASSAATLNALVNNNSYAIYNN